MQTNSVQTILKAIKEAKWLSINYDRDSRNTFFYFAITDIQPIKEGFLLKGPIFNPSKTEALIEEGNVLLNSIAQATIVENTTYSVPQALFEKIKNDREAFSVFNFEQFSNDILSYLRECYYYDVDPYQTNYSLINAIDQKELAKAGTYTLNEKQFREMYENILSLNNRAINEKVPQLAINDLSVATNGRIYVVAYRLVNLDLGKKTLTIQPEYVINKSFLIEGKKHTLGQYLDMKVQDFVENYTEKRLEYQDELSKNLIGDFEKKDTEPYLMLINRDMKVKLDRTLDEILARHDNSTLTAPLQAYFGEPIDYAAVKKNQRIAIIDNRANITQVRAVYNAMRNPITYVQGPPGTGKTQTLINVLVSAFFNSQKVLVCSNNNKPIDDILDKIKLSYRGYETPFPILRIGNDEENLKTLDKLLELDRLCDRISVIDEEKLTKRKIEAERKFKGLSDALEMDEERQELIEARRSAQAWFDFAKGGNQTDAICNNIKKTIDDIDEKLKSIPEISNSDIKRFVFNAREDYDFSQYIHYLSFKFLKRLKNTEFKGLMDIARNPDSLTKCADFNKYLCENENIENLLNVFPFFATTNLSANKIGTPDHLFFDLCVMDEAGQCSIATSLIPLARSERLLLVGDQNQLQPVVVLEENINQRLMDKYKIPKIYDYCDNSIMKLMDTQDQKSTRITLYYHYRCGKKIIQFSNQRYYNNMLIVGDENPGKLEYVPVKNTRIKDVRNAYEEEAAAIVEIVKKNKYEDVGIITPFRNQAFLINERLKDAKITNVFAGTIHTFQGGEKKVIIMSSAISQYTSEQTYDWMKNNKPMINVGITRAQENFILVGDFDSIKNYENDDDYVALVKYVKSNGELSILPRFDVQKAKNFSNDSKNEKELFDTLTHIFTIETKYYVVHNKPMKEIISEQVLANLGYETKKEADTAIYYKAGNQPIYKAIIEVGGGEHLFHPERIRRDKEKFKLVLQEKGIVLITIANSTTRDYQTIKDIIDKLVIHTSKEQNETLL